MKILIMISDYPHPVNTGRRMRDWSFINALSQEHDVSFLCFDKWGRIQPPGDLGSYFKNVWLVQPKNSRIEKTSRLENLVNFVRGIPWDIYAGYSPDLNARFKSVLEQEKFDVVFCRYIYQAQYCFRNRHRIEPRIFVDLDDIEPLKWKRSVGSGAVQFAGAYDRFRSFLNCWTFERYHQNLKKIDKIFVCSSADRDYVLQKRWARYVDVIPNSITVANYKEVPDYDLHAKERKTILFCGNLGYKPNEDGIIWFMGKVLPLIRRVLPSVKMNIVGMNPGEAIKRLADQNSVFVFPNVPSVFSYYAQSSLVVAPIWIAGGTRIKILEAFACRRPVVATTIGAEGLGIIPEKQCLIADTPQEFARLCTEVMTSFEKARRLTEEGYIFVKSQYDTEVVKTKILEAFGNV